MKPIIGYITSGSLSEGFVMKIDSNTNLETIKTGKFVCINGAHYRFFSLVSDLSLHVSNPDILLFPPSNQEPLLHAVLKKKDIYATATLKPMLMLDTFNKKMPPKTIPAHFSTVCQADNADIALVFGDERDKSNNYFHIGYPLDMESPICIDLERLTERSTGIFGKTGTGKTFLTRLLLAGLINREKATLLIFDMHNEYGIQARTEAQSKEFVKGLKTLFQDKIAICSLDPETTRKRGAAPDIELLLPYQAIQIDDILSLQDELNLHSTAVEAAYLIAAKYKKDWLAVLLNQGEHLKEFAQQLGAHPESIAALYRKLKRIEHLPFFQSSTIHYNCIDQMMDYIDKGINIIIEFGNYTSSFCYLLIANIISRRIHQAFVNKTEKFLASKNLGDEPKKLIICIEEAHKFLNPITAKQTIFATIAREMRKYYVSLLVIDQRPSGIDQEIISQIGTKIIAQLNDEKDIQAVLTGVPHATNLRTILACLETKKQVLVLGHAIAMPIVIQTREYNEAFYQAMQPFNTYKNIDKTIAEIF